MTRTLESVVSVSSVGRVPAYAGCSQFAPPEFNAATASPMQLDGTEWGFPGETGKHARFLQFHSSSKVVGFTGCNRFTGHYSQNGVMLSFGPLATTRRACLPEVMKREEQFLEVLSLARNAEVGQLELTLRDAKGDVLAQLVRRSSN